MENPILSQPIQKKKKQEGGFDESNTAFLESVMTLTAFGFSEKNCKIALKKCDMNMERAGDYLMNHMGQDLEEDEVAPASSEWQPD